MNYITVLGDRIIVLSAPIQSSSEFYVNKLKKMYSVRNLLNEANGSTMILVGWLEKKIYLQILFIVQEYTDTSHSSQVQEMNKE